MDIDSLYLNIRECCAQKGISISQLEKDLRFGTGAIGKWKQSFPSIEKVALVADFFRVSVDELCGLNKHDASREQFVEALIQKTMNKEMTWHPCFVKDYEKHRFCPSFDYDEIDKMYSADYQIGSLYLKEEQGELTLYISVKDSECMQQEESVQQLWTLWDAIKEKEEELQANINDYKALIMNG